MLNKKRLGTFKDETHAKPIVEFVGWRAKSYSLLVLQDDGDKNLKRVAKGVPRVAVPVSYTHLDVYKRQDFSSLALILHVYKTSLLYPDAFLICRID